MSKFEEDFKNSLDSSWTCGCLYKCNDCERLEKSGESKKDFFERKDSDYED